MPERQMFRASYEDILDEVRPLMKAVAIKSVRLIKDRVQHKGLNSKGNAFPSYSEGYAAYRKSKGRTEKVNLSFTNNMLRNLKPIGSGSDGRSVIIGFDRPHEADKARWTTDLKGTWIKNTDAEIADLRRTVEKRLGAVVVRKHVFSIRLGS